MHASFSKNEINCWECVLGSNEVDVKVDGELPGVEA